MHYYQIYLSSLQNLRLKYYFYYFIAGTTPPQSTPPRVSALKVLFIFVFGEELHSPFIIVVLCKVIQTTVIRKKMFDFYPSTHALNLLIRSSMLLLFQQLMEATNHNSLAGR